MHHPVDENYQGSAKRKAIEESPDSHIFVSVQKPRLGRFWFHGFPV